MNRCALCEKESVCDVVDEASVVKSNCEDHAPDDARRFHSNEQTNAKRWRSALSAASGREGFRPHPAFGHPLPDSAVVRKSVVRRARGTRNPTRYPG